MDKPVKTTRKHIDAGFTDAHIVLAQQAQSANYKKIECPFCLTEQLINLAAMFGTGTRCRISCGALFYKRRVYKIKDEYLDQVR